MGVKVVTDFVVGKTRSVDSILEEYDAVFIGAVPDFPGS